VEHSAAPTKPGLSSEEIRASSCLPSVNPPPASSILPSNNRQQSVIAMNPSVTQYLPGEGGERVSPSQRVRHSIQLLNQREIRMKAGVKYLLTYTLQYTCTAEAGGNPGAIHSRNCPRVVRIRRNYIKGALPRSNCTLLLLL